MSDTPPPTEPSDTPPEVPPSTDPAPAPDSPVPGSDMPDPTVDPNAPTDPGSTPTTDPTSDPSANPISDPTYDPSDQTNPNYDATKDPTSQFYDAERDPNSPLYRPEIDPNSPLYDATLDPNSSQYDPYSDPNSPFYNGGTGGGTPAPTGPTSAAVFRLAYASSPLDEAELYLSVDRDIVEIPHLRVECGGVTAGRLLIAQLSIGLAEPDGGFGHWGFRFYAGEKGEQPVLMDEALMPVTGYPFKPSASFTCPTAQEFNNLVVFVETYLSQGTGNLRVSDTEPQRMHSFLAVLDYGPLNS